MRKSRLSQHKQNKLIELFVAGVTARTSAELVNVNKNTAAFYFHRLRLLIYQNSLHLEMFEGEIEADESYFGGSRKGKRGRGAAGKVGYSGCSSVTVKFIPSLCRILNQQHCSQLFESKLSLIVLFTQILIVVMMCLMSVNLVIFVSITVRILRKIITTLTELRIFGTKLNAIYVSLMVFLKLILSFT